MSYFCKNAQEEALKGIEKQMWIKNKLELLNIRYQLGAITKEEYLEKIEILMRYS